MWDTARWVRSAAADVAPGRRIVEERSKTGVVQRHQVLVTEGKDTVVVLGKD